MDTCTNPCTRNDKLIERNSQWLCSAMPATVHFTSTVKQLHNIITTQASTLFNNELNTRRSLVHVSIHHRRARRRNNRSFSDIPPITQVPKRPNYTSWKINTIRRMDSKQTCPVWYTRRWCWNGYFGKWAEDSKTQFISTFGAGMFFFPYIMLSMVIFIYIMLIALRFYR